MRIKFPFIKEVMTDVDIQKKKPQSAGSRGLKHVRKKIFNEGRLVLKRRDIDQYLMSAIEEIANYSKSYPGIIARIYTALTGNKTTYNPKTDSYIIDKK